MLGFFLHQNIQVEHFRLPAHLCRILVKNMLGNKLGKGSEPSDVAGNKSAHNADKLVFHGTCIPVAG